MKICKCLVPNWTNMSNFQQLEVVGRGSETQLQVAENLNKLTLQDKGYAWLQFRHLWTQRVFFNFKSS